MISVYALEELRCTKCLCIVGVNLDFKEDGKLRVHIVHPPSSGFICPDENQIIEIKTPSMTEDSFG